MFLTNKAVFHLQLFITILISSVLLYGCSGTGSPVAPDTETNTQSTSQLSNSLIWGIWHVEIDPSTGTVNTEPVRSTQTHWDVTGFIKPPSCPGCIAFSNVTILDPQTLSVDVFLTHPFPGMPEYDGYDVRGIALAKPVLTMPSGTVSDMLVDPDGYTARWSSAPWADINAFMEYATDVQDSKFASGATHSMQFTAKLPASGPLVFDYVVDASWYPPSLVNPAYPLTDNHTLDAVKLDVNVVGPISPLPGSKSIVMIGFTDWQNDGGSANVTLEIPDLVSAPLTMEKVQGSSPVNFMCAVGNELAAPVGTYRGLVCIRDTYNDSGIDDLTTFQVVEISVTDQIPTMTGIVINPDAVCLMDTGSQGSFSLYGQYSDQSVQIVTDSVVWQTDGLEINGNVLAEVYDNGTVTRLSSKWFGGIATLTAKYNGFEDTAEIICHDPFADESEVNFGELNEPGTTFTHPEALIGPPTGGGSGAGGLSVCSLGYGGVATLSFTDNVIVDGVGPDFIVFENAFATGGVCEWNGEDQYSVWNETAAIEVSQDGIQWYKIPCDYNPDNYTCGPEPYVNPSSFSGLAGNHPVIAMVNADGTLKNDIDPTDPETAGGDAFDLASVGLAWCRYVRLIDTGDPDYTGTHLADDDGDLIYNFGNVSPMGAVPGVAGFDGDAIAAVYSADPLSVL